MILTVKLGNVDYKTIAIELPQKHVETDQDYLTIVNELARKKVWEEFSSYERAQHRNNFENFKAPPIVMMYSRNRHSYTD